MTSICLAVSAVVDILEVIAGTARKLCKGVFFPPYVMCNWLMRHFALATFACKFQPLRFFQPRCCLSRSGVAIMASLVCISDFAAKRFSIG